MNRDRPLGQRSEDSQHLSFFPVFAVTAIHASLKRGQVSPEKPLSIHQDLASISDPSNPIFFPVSFGHVSHH
jgi:hypothetical protein